MTRSYAAPSRYDDRVPLPTRLLTADRGDEGLRLDLVLRRHLTDVHRATRTRVQAGSERGRLTAKGKAARRGPTRAALGDIVSGMLPDETPRPPMAAEQVALD